MSELNQHIDNAARFQQPPQPDAPLKDQSSYANFALQWAQRQTQAPAPEVQKPLGAMPIPN